MIRWLRSRSWVPGGISGPRLLILGFAVIILIGTILLRLPIASAGEEPLSWLDALFTATSATTVTGLVVVSSGADLSVFGQVVALVLIQVGGVGFIAIAVLLFSLIGRRVTLQERFLLRQSLGVVNTAGIVRLTLYVMTFAVLIEGIGAVLLFVRWLPDMPPATAAFMAIFHSVSAFCNAGFNLFTDTEYEHLWLGYGQDLYSILVLSPMIVIGGFGITVVYDLWSWRKDRHLTLHTRLTLWLTAVLTLLGMAIILFDEIINQSAIGQLPWDARLLTVFYYTIAARSAGLTFTPVNDFSEASQVLLMVYMFIGAAPASMGAGISTSTFAVLAIAFWSQARGYERAQAFGRIVPEETIFKAVAVLMVNIFLFVVLIMVLLLSRAQPDVFFVLFEAASAVGNAGYSLGETTNLTSVGKVAVIVCMFWGRLGALTVVVALAQRRRRQNYSYPEERVIIG